MKKRQWQDLNLRIQRIIDFKSIALDHSATLSSLYKLFLFYSFRFFYVYISFFIITFFCLPLFSMSLILLLLCLSSFLFFSLSYVPSFSFYSVISNSIVGPVSSPVTWKTGVRIPVGEFFWNFYFLSYYSHASCGLYFLLTYYCLGGVAHMVEHSLCMRGARGSIPRISIIINFLF